ncbi:MAG: hypothetical protein QQW96_12755 [Tychonema bourrellyi B0820]|uniref:Uncharacterized protein n=2 Tax=Microcoleaceae TaxID=1892252 RepID=A0A2G4EYX2_9CYAN|nr:hypothetical protein [Tychonema bourrellyi]MDQ2098504.1 hypothetical protein [Tychonema bourrellyi B0820]PHX54725.1 hypothetical protein CP500_014545 [Tychonema bourrellyi FEM_GT703]
MTTVTAKRFSIAEYHRLGDRGFDDITMGWLLFHQLKKLKFDSNKPKSLYFLVRVGGLCLYSSGFNRRIIYARVVRNRVFSGLCDRNQVFS